MSWAKGFANCFSVFCYSWQARQKFVQWMSQLKDELEEHAFLVEADEWLQGLQEGPQPGHL